MTKHIPVKEAVGHIRREVESLFGVGKSHIYRFTKDGLFFFSLDAFLGAEVLVTLLRDECQTHDIKLIVAADEGELHVTASKGRDSHDVGVLPVVSSTTYGRKPLHCNTVSYFFT